MRIRREALDYRVVVRKVTMGAAPFGWDVRYMDALTPVHVSTTRFRSMDAAYKDGHAWLADFLSASLPPPRKEASNADMSVPSHRSQDRSASGAAATPPAAPEVLPEGQASVHAVPAPDQRIGTADPVYPSYIG